MSCESYDQLLNMAVITWQNLLGKYIYGTLTKIKSFITLSRTFCVKTNLNSDDRFIVKQSRFHTFVIYYFSYLLPSLTDVNFKLKSTNVLFRYISTGYFFHRG